MDGLFGGMFDEFRPRTPASETARLKHVNEEALRRSGPLPQIRRKMFDGVAYVRIEDVVVALERSGKKDWPLTQKLRRARDG